MKKYLNNKGNCYVYCCSNNVISFNLEDIKCFQIQKKHCFISILFFMIYSIGVFIFLSFYFALSFILIILFLFFSLLFFITFLYYQNYEINIKLVKEQIFFESKDEDLIQDFLMLHYFYYDYLESNYNLLIDLS